MKKLIVTGGVILLILGIVLAASTFIVIPKNTTQAYQIPQSTVIVDHFGLLGPTFGVRNPTADWEDGFSFNTGDLLNIQVNVTSSKKINFYVEDSKLDSTVYLSYPNITEVNTDWVVPNNSSYYYFHFSSSGTVSANDIHWKVEKIWNETDYRTLTQNVPLLPLPIFYVGVAFAISGLAVVLYWNKPKRDKIV